MKTAVKKKNNIADRSFTNIGNEDVISGIEDENMKHVVV